MGTLNELWMSFGPTIPSLALPQFRFTNILRPKLARMYYHLFEVYLLGNVVSVLWNRESVPSTHVLSSHPSEVRKGLRFLNDRPNLDFSMCCVVLIIASLSLPSKKTLMGIHMPMNIALCSRNAGIAWMR